MRYNNDMHDYVVSKAVAISIPLFFIFAGTLVFSEPRVHWWGLLIVTMILGYVHYAIGLWYQIRSFQKKNDSVALVVLALLICFSLVFCMAVISSGNFIFLSIGVIAYFIVHGALNEKTLLSMQTGIHIPTRYFATLALVFIALMFASLEHDAFFFDTHTTFLNVDAYVKEAAIEQVLGIDPLPIALAIVGFFFVSLFLLCYEVIHRKIFIVTSIVGCGVLGAIFFWHPINYMYLFHLYLGYHFLVWSIVFLQRFRREGGGRLRCYLRDHAVVLVPLCVAAILFAVEQGVSSDGVHSVIFSVDVFITGAFIHITTSLMNESWFKRLLGSEDLTSPKRA